MVDFESDGFLLDPGFFGKTEHAGQGSTFLFSHICLVLLDAKEDFSI